MDVENHTPSLTHLRDFVLARSKGRATRVESDRKQVQAPAHDRIFAFAYERFLTAVIEYVRNGNSGGALDRAAFNATERMRASYTAAATGMAILLGSLRPSGATRRQRNVIVRDSDGYDLVSLRLHLVFERQGLSIGTFMYFSEKALGEAELRIMETSVALAARQIDPLMVPAIAFVRTGELRIIDVGAALSPMRLHVLRSESVAYHAAWAVAA